jgi:hypothetical protein
MDSSFWLGECVWNTPMMLWLIFVGSTLGICGVMGIAKLDATVHCVRLPGPGGLSAASAWTVRVALAATLVASSFMDLASFRLIIVRQCLYSFKHLIYDNARKTIASITKKVTKKATSKKKSKDVGTSKRRRKDDTSEE